MRSAQVSALRDEAEAARVALKAAEARNKEASRAHAADSAALQIEVSRA
jgi:hypothetical protein